MGQLPRTGKRANFFDAWPDIARCLGIRPIMAKYKAIANMWDLLQGGGGGLSGGGGGRGVGSSAVGHPQGGQCASTVHDLAVCIL